jgi:hypothetical protein
MKKSLLFAIEPQSGALLVSESEAGSNKIAPVERLSRADNPALYDAAVALGSISRAPDLDVATFKAMDKVCQRLYAQHAARS